MGFYIMLLSFILGIYLTILSISRRKRKRSYLLLLVPGILLVIFAVYLARPH